MSSSLTSKSSNTLKSTFLNSIQPKQMPQSQTDIASNELAIESYINSLQLSTFFQLSEKEQSERLEKIDVLELFHAVENLNHELAMLQLENYFLIDFLQKNDPKLLIGLEQRRATAQSVHSQASVDVGKMSNITVANGRGTLSTYRAKSTASKSFLASISLHTSSSQKKTTAAYEYKLNYRAKADMAEKLANEVDKRVQEIENKGNQEIKILRARIEELHFTNIETQETTKNFQLHFLSDEREIAFLNTATEKQIVSKFKKFINNWIKNARALLATMRLRITSLQEQCQHLRNELLTKSDLSGILTAIDFEKLMIKRTELLNSLEEKNAHMAGLKGVTGRAALSMAEEKQIMINIEEESKLLTNKTLEVVKTIGKLQKEAESVEAENRKDFLTLENLRAQLERYEAPSVNQYIQKKEEVLALEKEEKILKRKIYILQMKLNNTLKKCKRKIDNANIIINIIE